ncbi:hypothetical protein J6590_068852 [Homalodisca vitripennis]|nr:hypothetical protein J6590_068852 [Homalodisca vitripennis]
MVQSTHRHDVAAIYTRVGLKRCKTTRKRHSAGVGHISDNSLRQLKPSKQGVITIAIKPGTAPSFLHRTSHHTVLQCVSLSHTREIYILLNVLWSNGRLLTEKDWLKGEVRAKKPSLTLNLGTKGDFRNTTNGRAGGLLARTGCHARHCLISLDIRVRHPLPALTGETGTEPARLLPRRHTMVYGQRYSSWILNPSKGIIIKAPSLPIQKILSIRKQHKVD